MSVFYTREVAQLCSGQAPKKPYPTNNQQVIFLYAHLICAKHHQKVSARSDDHRLVWFYCGQTDVQTYDVDVNGILKKLEMLSA